MPTAKVAAGGAAGSVTVLLVYVLGLFNLTMPAEVGSAITVLFTLAVGYLVKERPAADTETGPAAAN